MGGSGLRSCSRKITASRIEGPLPTTQILHLEVDSRLQQVDDPGGVLQDKLVAVKCTADHLELHVRGVTAEPWDRADVAAKGPERRLAARAEYPLAEAVNG